MKTSEEPREILLVCRLNRDWYAVYIQTPREEPTVIAAVTMLRSIEIVSVQRLAFSH